jgi:hypothetical protein
MECLDKQSQLVHQANDRTSEARNGSASTLIAFECECGDLYCWETIIAVPDGLRRVSSCKQRHPPSRAAP